MKQTVSKETFLAAISFFFAGYFFANIVNAPVAQPVAAAVRPAAAAAPAASSGSQNIDDNIALLLSGLKVDSANPGRFTDLGHSYIEKKDYGSAWNAYVKAVQIGGATSERLIGLARVSVWYERMDAAEKYLLDAFKIAPDDPEVLYQLGLFYFHTRNDHATALRYWKKFLAKSKTGSTHLAVSATVEQIERRNR